MCVFKSFSEGNVKGNQNTNLTHLEMKSVNIYKIMLPETSLSQSSSLNKENSQDVSLTLKTFGGQLDGNQHQINFMEKFIQQKYSEIADLQKYLVDELQIIESGKKNGEKIETIIKTKTLPTLLQLKQVLEDVKILIQPINRLSLRYVEEIGQKCKDLLEKKQQKCSQYQEEIHNLKLEVISLREELSSKELSQKKDITPQNEVKHQEVDEICLFDRHKISKKEEKKDQNKKMEKSLSKDRFGNSPYLNNCFGFGSKEEFSPRNGMKVSPRRSEVKTANISQPQVLQSKVINIKYRCQKSPTFGKKSPSRSGQKTEIKKKYRKDESDPLATRKDYIKKKIQNIKRKAEKDYENAAVPKFNHN